MNECLSSEFCPDCGVPYNDRILSCGEDLLCACCGKKLKKYGNPYSLQIAWALVTASLICMLMANVTPIIVFNVSGNTQSSFMITGVESLFLQGYWPVALLIFLCSIALPMLHLLAYWYLLGGSCLQAPWPGLKKTLFIVETLMPWNLIPVFAVATMAAVVKLKQLGTIEWQSGALWIGFLAILSLITTRFFNRRLFEDMLASIEISS